MKKAVKIILIILIIILIKLLFNTVTNSLVINSYNKGNYSTNLVKSLYFLNFPEPYIPYYNEGTILYQQEKYDEAKSKFTEALKHKPKEKYVCDIRINLSLSMLATINLEDCENAPAQLEAARKVLYEDNCAGDNGKDKDAKKLEQEIKGLEDKLKETCKGGDDGGNSGDDGGDDEKPTPSEEQKQKEIEQKLKEQQKNSQKSRGEELESIESEYIINRKEKRW